MVQVHGLGLVDVVGVVGEAMAVMAGVEAVTVTAKTPACHCWHSSCPHSASTHLFREEGRMENRHRGQVHHHGRVLWLELGGRLERWDPRSHAAPPAGHTGWGRDMQEQLLSLLSAEISFSLHQLSVCETGGEAGLLPCTAKGF